MNFGIIGTNFITDWFLAAGAEVEGFHLKAVYSRSKEKAEKYGREHGAELFFDSLEELAACKEVDAVYVASPNSLHAAQSIQMMKSGKHVICEKSMASNSREFRRMKETAVENHVVLLEAMRLAHTPGFAAIRENLYKLGTIRRVSFQYCQYSSRYDKFKDGIVENAFNPEFSNGALMDIGVYCVHPLVALFGLPERVLSSSIKLSNGAEGAGTILAEYKGMQGELTYSKIANGKIPSQIQGEEGTMVIESVAHPQKVTIYFRDGRTETLDIPELDAGMDMCYEIREFMRLIDAGMVDHKYLADSEAEIALMDEVRRQQGIVFPADKG